MAVTKRRANVAVWVLKGLLATVFLLAAAAKLAGHPRMVAEFGVIGLGQGFRLFTGVVELVGALLLLWPRASFFGALILLGVCAGACVAQAGPLHGDLIHVGVLAFFSGTAAWLTRPMASGDA